MTVTLKKLHEQVMVITGASSGIGLTTARMAAAAGARLVLVGRSEEALRQLRDEIHRDGGQAIFVVADVGKQAEVREIAQRAQAEFGGFDTWVNNAGTATTGRLEETPIEDMRRLFETNFWGVVYGSLEALKVLKQRGGALINIGSVESERAVIWHGIYAATKHAVKGFTDALRMELDAEDAPVSVTLIKPASINTPFTLNAKNYMDNAVSLPPPVYAPETVARAILHCAQTPTRDVFVGGAAKGLAMLEQWAPGLADKVMATDTFVGLLQKDEPARPLEANILDRPSERLAQRGDYEGYTREMSFYTKATLHPRLTTLALLGAGLAVAAWLRSGRNGEEPQGMLPDRSYYQGDGTATREML